MMLNFVTHVTHHGIVFSRSSHIHVISWATSRLTINVLHGIASWYSCLSMTSTCCPESSHQKYGAAFTARTSAPNNWQTSDTASITTSPWKAAYAHAIVSSQPPSLSGVSLQKLVSRSGKISGRLPRATWRNMTSIQKNNSRVVTHCRGEHSGRPTECARDRLPSRQQNICGATVRTNTVCAAQPHAIWTISWRAVHISGRYRAKTTSQKWRVELCDGWAPLRTRYDDDPWQVLF